MVRDSRGVESQNASLRMNLKSVPTAFGRFGGRHVELRIRRSRRASSQACLPSPQAETLERAIGLSATFCSRITVVMTSAVGMRDMA